MAVLNGPGDFLEIQFEAMRPAGFLLRQGAQIQATVENVDRGHGWVPNPCCPVCGSVRREQRFERFGRRILQCLDCDVGYVDAFPADVRDVYDASGYLDAQGRDYLDNVDYRKRRFGAERLGILRRHLKVSVEGARLLDVGCGTGWFLEVAKSEGYEVSGLEIGRDLARHTADKLGIEVHTVPLTELSADTRYDVITLFDVLEHVTDPGAMLKAVRDRLNPGGIALIFVPNLDSVGLGILGGESSLIMPAEHLYYFTPASLRRLIEETPMQVLEFQTKGMDMPDTYAYYRDVLKNDAVAGFLADRGSMLQAAIDAAGRANHMRFVITPGGSV